MWVPFPYQHPFLIGITGANMPPSRMQCGDADVNVAMVTFNWWFISSFLDKMLIYRPTFFSFVLWSRFIYLGIALSVNGRELFSMCMHAFGICFVYLYWYFSSIHFRSLYTRWLILIVQCSILNRYILVGYW